MTKTPSSRRPRVAEGALDPPGGVAARRSIRASPTMSPTCHGGRPRYLSMSKSAGMRKSRSRRVAKRMSPRIRETRNVRMSSRSRSCPTTYQTPLSGSSAYGLTRALGLLVAADRPVAELHRALLRDRRLELAEPARHLGGVVGVEHLDAHRGLASAARRSRAGRARGSAARAAAAPRRRTAPRAGRGRSGAPRARRPSSSSGGQEVALGAQRVELLAGELVALRLERHAERDQLGAVGVEAAREGLVRHLGVALDVRLDVARRERPALRHEERDQRELTDELVGVVRHRMRAYRPSVTERCRAKGNRPGAPGDLDPALAAEVSLRGDLRALEVLVRRAVVALRQRRALARLALARRRLAAGDAAVERAGLDLLVDELDRRVRRPSATAQPTWAWFVIGK